MKKTQDQVVLESEGDNWFTRNKTALTSEHLLNDQPLLLLDLYQIKPQRVLEIGCANGYRLAQIAAKYSCRTVGVEPSAQAIAHGRSQFPAVEFIQALAHEIPLQETFDLIIINFVLYIVDRSRILQVAAEIDRLLIDNGLLIIGDFFPANQYKLDYHHLTETEFFTYKQNYGALFLASGIYRPIGLLTGSHSSPRPAIEPHEQEKRGTWLLQKTLNGLYTHTHLSTNIPPSTHSS